MNTMIDDRMISASLIVPGNAYRIAKMMDRLSRRDGATVAFIGGSITQGSLANPQSAKCYAALTRDWFMRTWPAASIEYVNAGVGATGSYLGVHRAEADVISKSPDIVFVDFSVNDTEETIDRDLPAYDALMRNLWNAPSRPAIIAIVMTQDTGISVQEHHRKVTAAYGIPTISYRDAVLGAIGAGSLSWGEIAADNIHPNNEGHRILSELLVAYLERVRAAIPSILAGAEPSLPEVPAVSPLYCRARLVSPVGVDSGTANASVDAGCFTERVSFGNMKSPCWQASAQEGSFGGKSFVAKIRARNVGVIYGKINTEGSAVTSAVITVSGARGARVTVDTDFTGWTGAYLESLELVRGTVEDDYIVEIAPKDAMDGKFVIAGISVS